jgi:hypothetical protein
MSCVKATIHGLLRRSIKAAIELAMADNQRLL